MSRLNLQSFSSSDSQSDLVSKLNTNFNQVVNSFGGTLGDQGPTGERGNIGLRGPAGATGNMGRRGTRWFVQSNGPTGPDVNTGDYWLDANADCYIYQSSGWNIVGSLKRDQDLFKTVENVVGPAGITSGVVTALNQLDPSDFGFVVADDQPEQAGNLNPEGAKFVISSNPSVSTGYPLEFSRLDKDTFGSTGSIDDTVKHPFFAWETGLDLSLQAPNGSIKIDFGGGAAGSASINTVNDVTLEARTGSITFGNQQVTASGNIIVNAAGGKLLVSGTYISISAVESNFGVELTDAFNFNLTPSVSSTTGYFNVTKNAGDGNSVYSYAQPVMRVTRFFTYGTNLYSSASAVNLGKFTSAGSGTVLEIRANGKIYTKKTSERYYNNTTSPIITWTTP
jgi:hypothetical protein